MPDSTSALICVVDDDLNVRESIAMLLGSIGVATRGYRDCRSFLKDPEALAADGLILDIRLPGINGLEFQEQFADRLGDMPIIFVSGHGDIPMAVRAMRQGALDFLQKPFPEQALLDRVNQAIALGASRREQRVEQAAIRARIDLLTPREREVLDFVVQGLSSKVIGDTLDISVRTVEQHRARLMDKMRAASVADLIHALNVAGHKRHP